MVNMTEYIKNIISDFPEEIISMKASPASDHLYKVQDLILSNLLPKEQAWAFHHDFAQVSEWQGTQRYTAGRGILDNQSQSSQ